MKDVKQGSCKEMYNSDVRSETFHISPFFVEIRTYVCHFIVDYLGAGLGVVGLRGSSSRGRRVSYRVDEDEARGECGTAPCSAGAGGRPTAGIVSSAEGRKTDPDVEGTLYEELGREDDVEGRENGENAGSSHSGGG